MPPAARLADMHTCPMVTGTVPHVGGPILPTCAITVITCSMPQARVGDMLTCVGPPDTIVKGSASVMVNNMPAARIGDMTAHGGVIVVGAPTVIIGDAGGGGGGGAAPVMTSAGSYLAPAAQAKALINAAKEGHPFCERCAAAAAAKSAATSAAKAAAPAEVPGANIIQRLYQKGRAKMGVPGGKAASAAYEVNPKGGTINCGNIIDAVHARLSGKDPAAIAPAEQDGSFSEIEKRFGTKLDQGANFDDAFKAVQDGGDGASAVVKIVYGSGTSSHVVILTNDKGAVGIVEGQGGGEFVTSAKRANKMYNSDGKSTVKYGMIPKK